MKHMALAYVFVAIGGALGVAVARLCVANRQAQRELARLPAHGRSGAFYREHRVV